MTRRNQIKAVLAYFYATAAWPQATRIKVLGEGRRRTALVIGNGAYKTFASLNHPTQDARLMQATLKKIGFDADKTENAEKQVLHSTVKSFLAQIGEGDVVLFYFSGHGVQIDHKNYLLPIDASASSELGLKAQALNAHDVVEEMNDSRASVKILILDACRNNPFGTENGSNGLNQLSSRGGNTLIAYATAPGLTAGDNGLYTSTLSQMMQVPGKRVSLLFEDVGNQVYLASHEVQTPWCSNGITGGLFYFVPPLAADLLLSSRSQADFPGYAIAPSRDKWALLIGIDGTANEKTPHLRFAKRGAVQLSAALTDPQLGKFKPENVRLLTNETATTANLKRALSTLLERARPDDFVLLYIASRSLKRSLDDQTAYFVSYDTIVESQDDVYATALPFVELMQFVRSLKTGRITILLDTDLGPFWLSGPSQITASGPVSGVSERGRTVIAACDVGEAPRESLVYENSVFLHFILEAIKGSGGLISPLGLYNYIAEKVPQAVTNPTSVSESRRSQHPTLLMGGQESRVMIGAASSN